MATPMQERGDREVREVARKVRGQPTSDGAGVRMTRVIGRQRSTRSIRSCCSTSSAPTTRTTTSRGFPDHPHRGFETVTYMLAGRMRHGDNQGNTGLLGPGSVQWMTAGRGIVHSEFPEQQEGLMWGFQLWVNLPAHGQDDGAALSRHPGRRRSRGRARPRRESARARRHRRRRRRAR